MSDTKPQETPHDWYDRAKAKAQQAEIIAILRGSYATYEDQAAAIAELFRGRG